MTTLRSPRATYVAAFLLGALIALIFALPARSAEPFRLDRVGIVRFTEAGEGKLRRQQGVMDVEGRVHWRASFELDRPANTPVWALNRYLITSQAWQSYYQLGFGALENFELTEGSVRFVIGDESYHFVQPNPFAYFASGRVINLSTRARVGAGGDEVVAGFVIEERPRTVLVRAVGPSLAAFGVAGPTPDPFLSVKRNGQTLQFNDNWGTRGDMAEIRAVAARVGAFPLEDLSRDAALLLILPPGAYTAHVQAAAPEVPGGQVLIEIYSVPDEVLILEAASS